MDFLSVVVYLEVLVLTLLSLESEFVEWLIMLTVDSPLFERKKSC